MTAEALFVFGTLRHLPLLHAVAGADLAVETAVLPDHRAVHAVDLAGIEQSFPRLQAHPGAEAEGLILYPGPEARERLHAYERLFGYDPQLITVRHDGRTVQAQVYLTDPDLWHAGRPWSLSDWQTRFGPIATSAAHEVMVLLALHGPDAVRARYGMLEVRAASHLRAQAETRPATLRRAARPGDIASREHRRPYARFFGVEETDLSFRRFDGSMSPTVNRAGFIMGDAVTVLPYDPVTDRVMLVEQFRYGPHARGDTNPWSLEPIAGRIDPGESPEQTARREAHEETGLDLTALEYVGGYYISPGAVTEYILSYVALTRLATGMAGVGGLETEAEDIRSHIIPFARMMELVASGEIANAPLIITAQWLAMNRDRLRGGAA